jgi:hypothetical protein
MPIHDAAYNGSLCALQVLASSAISLAKFAALVSIITWRRRASAARGIARRLTITTSVHELAASKIRTSPDPTCPVPPTTKSLAVVVLGGRRSNQKQRRAHRRGRHRTCRASIGKGCVVSTCVPLPLAPPPYRAEAIHSWLTRVATPYSLNPRQLLHALHVKAFDGPTLTYPQSSLEAALDTHSRKELARLARCDPSRLRCADTKGSPWMLANDTGVAPEVSANTNR